MATTESLRCYNLAMRLSAEFFATVIEVNWVFTLQMTTVHWWETA